jgi:stage II sporulation protein D
MRRPILLTLLCACLVVPGAASAATIFVVHGRGFGHGIGMSQYGAQGFAQHGWDYRRILARYYTGTATGTAPTRTIRVLLSTRNSSVAVSHVSRAGSKRLSATQTYTGRVHGNGIELRDSRGHRAARFGGPVRVRGPRGYVVAGGAYRGEIELRPSIGGGVTAINRVPLDDYVQGVIPGEMPSTWLPEALKVQAVAARSYALATDVGGPLFDQYADTRSQVYLGMSAERPTTNAAARATAGQIVLYNGRVAVTYYFSTSGGRTENVENVFYGAKASPYLRSVKDPYDGASPRHSWQFRFTQAQIQARLGPLCRGNFRAIKVLKRGASPRVVVAQVVCSGGRTRTNGAALRRQLGLYDTWFSVTKASSASAGTRSKDMSVPLVSGLVHPRTISGGFSPAPPRVDVERLEQGRWRLVARGLTNRLGAYSVPVYQGGTYRVSGGGVSADPLTLR